MSDFETDSSSLPSALRKSVRELRGAFSGAITNIGGDASRPRELARKLSVDKTLAWKISRMVTADSDHEALQFLPGDAAMDLFLDAVESAGGKGDTLLQTRNVVLSFRESMQTHIGDRPTLDIVLDALPGRQSNRFLNSRKLAFRGNSGIWGVQARARIQAAFFFPSPTNSDLIDIALIAGWVDFRRLRQDAKWVLFRHSFHQSTEGIPFKTEPLDPWDQGTSGLNLLREFCTDPAPQLRHTRVGDEMHYQLYDGPLGNAGVFTCFMGSVTRAVGKRIAENPAELGRVGAMISAPVENILFDLFLHKDIPVAGPPQVEVVSGLTSVVKPLESDLLPLEEEVTELEGTPPCVDTPLLPAYKSLVAKVYKILRLTPTDFRAYRYDLKYPPFPSTVRFCVHHKTEVPTTTSATAPLEAATAPVA